MLNIEAFLLVLGIGSCVFIGFCWAAAYDQESLTASDNLFFIGAFWLVILIWMIFYGIFCTINKWYRWATNR